MNYKLLSTTKHKLKVLDVVADEDEITLLQDKIDVSVQNPVVHQITLNSLEDIGELTDALNDIKWWWEATRKNNDVPCDTQRPGRG